MKKLTKVFEGKEVRVFEVENEPWFVASDVCNILEIKNTTDALKRLDEDERSRFNLGRQGEVNTVNEFGLYTLILGSRKTEAKKFKRWVTHEVIPSIRKTGSYVQPKSQAELTAMIAQQAVEQERRITVVEEKQDNIVSILSLDIHDWRNKVNKIINAIVMKLGGGEYYKEIRNESYQLLESRAACNLDIRLQNRKSKMALRGSSASAINKVTKLDVISEDKKLVSVYITVIKELAVKYHLNIAKYKLTEMEGV